MADKDLEMKVIFQGQDLASMKVKDVTAATMKLNEALKATDREGAIVTDTIKELEQAASGTGDALGETENALRDTEDALKDTEDGLNGTRDSLKDTEDALKNTAKSVATLSDDLKDVGAKAEAFGKSYSIGITAPIVAASGIIAKFGIDAVESENLFSVSFGNMADSARSWSVSVADALKLNEYELRKQSGTLYTMVESMGLSTDEAYKLSTSLTELSYDMASFYNISAEEGFDALKSGLSGEAEPLKRFGILVSDATIQQTAMQHGLVKSGEQLSEQGKVMARYLAIMDQTGKAQGDLARTMDSPANKLRAMKVEIEAAATKMGVALLPVIQQVINGASELTGVVTALSEKFQELPESTQQTLVAIAGIVAAIGPAAIVGGKLMQTIGAMIPVVKSVAPAVITLSTAFRAFNPVVLGLSIAIPVVGMAMSKLSGSTTDLVKAQEKAIATVKEQKEQLITLGTRYEELAGKTNRTKEEEIELEKIGQQLLALQPNLATSTDELAVSYKDRLTPAIDEAKKALTELEKTSRGLALQKLSDQIIEASSDMGGYASEAAKSVADVVGGGSIVMKMKIYDADNLKAGLAGANEEMRKLKVELDKLQVDVTQGKNKDKFDEYKEAAEALDEYINRLQRFVDLNNQYSNIKEFGLPSSGAGSDTTKAVSTETPVTKTKTVGAKNGSPVQKTEAEKEMDLSSIDKVREATFSYLEERKKKQEEIAAEEMDLEKMKADLTIETTRELYRQQVELGRISKADEVMLNAQLDRKALEYEKEIIDKRVEYLKGFYNDKGVYSREVQDELNTLNTQSSKLEQQQIAILKKADIQAAHERSKANIEAAKKAREAWISTFETVTNAVRQNLSNLLTEQRSAAEILRDIGVDMAQSALNAIIDKALSAITAYAAEGAAAAFATSASAGPAGLIAAPVVAAGTFGAISAFGGEIASAAGGYYQVPGDMMANIHKNEMVLPAREAQIIRENIKGGTLTGATSGGGLSGLGAVAFTDKDILKMIEKNGSALVKIAKRKL